VIGWYDHGKAHHRGAKDTEEIKTALLGSPFANRFVIGWYDRGKAYRRGAEDTEEIKTAPLESLFVITVQKRF